MDNLLVDLVHKSMPLKQMRQCLTWAASDFERVTQCPSVLTILIVSNRQVR